MEILLIKIYEINGEYYYKKNKKEISHSINLEGLMPMEEQKHSYNLPPYEAYNETFTFPILKNRHGIFVLDFIGEGISTRAIIKKGSLAVQTQPGVGGNYCYIMDEDRHICNGQNTGIWYEGVYYPADVGHGGKITLPFVNYNTTKYITLTHNGFAQYVNLQLYKREFRLTASIILNPESILMGHTAKLFIKPSLLLAENHEQPLDLLTNVIGILRIRNSIDGLPSVRKYKLDLINKPEIEFFVPPYINSLTLEITAQVKNLEGMPPTNLTFTYYSSFSEHSSMSDVFDLYLRRNPEEYQIHILGKNGEPKPRIYTELSLKLHYLNSPQKVLLISNEQGIISLGKLNNVQKITASAKLTSLSREVQATWKIENGQIFKYPKTIYLGVGDKLQLPIAKQPTIEIDPEMHNFQYIYLFSQDSFENPIANLTHKISILKNESPYYDHLTAELNPGKYILTIPGFSGAPNDINITVNGRTKSNILGDEGKIHEDLYLHQGREMAHIFKNENVKIKQVEMTKETDHCTIKILVDEFGKNCKIHLLANNYLPENNVQFHQNFLPINNHNNLQTIYFERWENIYVWNRPIPPEYEYVLRRKDLPHNMGIFLQKPRMMMKRHFETMANFGSTGGAGGCKKKTKMRGKSTEKSMTSLTWKGGYYKTIDFNTNKINLYQDFLENSGLQIFNTPCVNGEVKITGPFDKYSSLCILVENSSNVSMLNIPIDTEKKVGNRDLCLRTPLLNSKNYSEIRDILGIREGESYTVEDMTSTNIQIVDSLGSLLSILKELGGYKQGLQNKYDFLTYWNTLKRGEKNAKFSEFTGHELNIFLKKKDKDYFDMVVRPYILAKFDKTFIDYYLLDDIQQMEIYFNSPKSIYLYYIYIYI